MRYAIKKTWDGYAVLRWGVVNFDGIMAHDWKEVGREESFGKAWLFVGDDLLERDVYFEISKADSNDLYFSTDFEDAEELAQSVGFDIIDENGGNFETFKKCWFCGNFYPLGELDEDQTCDRCQMALWSRGEYERER